MALIYLQGGTEHTLILGVREVHTRQFQATDWTDLRVGFFLSLTRAAADEDPTTLTETIPSPSGTVPWTDRIRIGLTNSADGSIFLGYSNLPNHARLITPGQSMLVSSDIGIGTSNTRYWRPKNAVLSTGDYDAVHIIDAGESQATAPDGSQPHFVQDVLTANGGSPAYCTLFMLRFLRDNATGRARIITMQVKRATASGHSSDILFTTTPTVAILEAQLESFPTNVTILGPVELSYEPDTFYIYWPFSLSRLKIHAIGILKQA